MQQPSGPQPPVMPPPVFAAPVAPSLYRQAWRIVTANRRTMLLPLFVTSFPAAIALAIATFVLYHEIFPEAAISSFDAVQDNPTNLNLAVLMSNGIVGLFTLVGLAATIVAGKSVINNKPLGLAGTLDPAFTRMGGLLGLGIVYAGLALSTLFVPFVLFFIIRFGLSLHAFILDDVPLGQSLRSSWTVLRRKMLRFTGMLLAFTGITFLVMVGVVVVLSLVTAPFIGTEPTRTDEVMIATVLTAVVGLVFVPLGSFIITTMTLYYLREKKESGLA